MYHESKSPFTRSYYDTIEEMPNEVKVYFPDEKEPKIMSVEEVRALDNEGWYTIMHSVNWGSCDHWTSEKVSKWLNERFLSYWQYVDKAGKIVGYDRKEWSVRLTKEANYRQSEVWNS